MQPIIFLDIDDVLAISREYNSYQVMAIFKSGDVDRWPELWNGLLFASGRENLATLHREFSPQYVISSSWSHSLHREQMLEMFRRSGLEIVANNMHVHWTTPKFDGSSRTEELEGWIAAHRQLGQPMLVLDDHTSGWSLVESLLDQMGLVVLCEPGIGLVADKLVAAQRLLRVQFAPDVSNQC